MPRVALVTGGTRGIGAAIAKALKAAGYKVAAVYHGNDEAAQKFKAETGIAVYKWDVSSFDACAAGVKQVEAELGPIDVLVNNAGITRDAQLHRMKPEQWTEVINTNLGSLFNMTRQVIEGMRDAQIRPHHQHLLDQRPEGPVRSDQLFGRQSRRDRLHQSAGAGGRAFWHHSQRDRPGLYRHRDGEGDAEGSAGEEHPADRFRSAGSASRKRSGAAWCFLASDDAGLITGSTLTANGGQYIT